MQFFLAFATCVSKLLEMTRSKFLGSIEYSLIDINLRSTLTQNASTCLGPIYWSTDLFVFNRTVYQKKKKRKRKTPLKKQLYKNVNMNVQWMQFPNPEVQNNPRWVDMLLKSIMLCMEVNYKKVIKIQVIGTKILCNRILWIAVWVQG